MFDSIKLLKGTVSDLREKADEAEPSEASSETRVFQLDGHIVELDVSGGAASPSDGENLILAGPVHNGRVTGYAYVNLSRRKERRARGFASDFLYGWALLLLAALAAWWVWNGEFESPLFLWLVRVAGGLLLIFFGFLSLSQFSVINDKFRALFLVQRASLRILSGVAHHVVPDGVSPHKMHLTLNDEQIYLPMEQPPFREGDNVVIAAYPHDGVLQWIALYNVTQDASAKSWTTISRIASLLFYGAAATILAWLGAGTTFLEVIRYLVILIFASLLVSMMLHSFYLWRFESGAWRKLQDKLKTMSKQE